MCQCLRCRIRIVSLSFLSSQRIDYSPFLSLFFFFRILNFSLLISLNTEIFAISWNKIRYSFSYFLYNHVLINSFKSRYVKNFFFIFYARIGNVLKYFDLRIPVFLFRKF